MIRLKTIDTENIEDVLALSIRDDQKGFVISTAESLAKHLNESVGFKDTGLVECGMEEMRLIGGEG